MTTSKDVGQNILAGSKQIMKRTNSAGTNAPPMLIPSLPDCAGINKNEAFEAGKKAALRALENDASCLLGAMDEWRNSEVETAYAMGWIVSPDVV